MTLLEDGMIIGFMCPGCFVFAKDPNEISRDDGTCANCQEYFIMRVKVTLIEKPE